jgi:Tripartite tricarboxylate transporter family receptor
MSAPTVLSGQYSSIGGIRDNDHSSSGQKGQHPKMQTAARWRSAADVSSCWNVSILPGCRCWIRPTMWKPDARKDTRSHWLAVLAAFTAGEGSVAQAQGFPTRPVTPIRSLAGRWHDRYRDARTCCGNADASRAIHRIENRPGAGGALGPMHMAATATPDGHTISQIPLSLLRAAFLTKMTFDPRLDWLHLRGGGAA